MKFFWKCLLIDLQPLEANAFNYSNTEKIILYQHYYEKKKLHALLCCFFFYTVVTLSYIESNTF